MKLYEIKPEIEAILLNCVDENGELTEDAFYRLIELEQLKEEKIDSLLSYIKGLTFEAEAISLEKEQLEKRIKQKKNHVNRLKEFLSQYLEFSKFENSRHKVSFRKSETVEITSLEDVPLEYFKLQEPVINKIAIKEALKRGEKVEGAYLYEKQNIQIK